MSALGNSQFGKAQAISVPLPLPSVYWNQVLSAKS
jgi:hypothetical protein